MYNGRQIWDVYVCVWIFVVSPVLESTFQFILVDSGELHPFAMTVL